MALGNDVYDRLLRQHGNTVRALAIPTDKIHAERLKLALFSIEYAKLHQPIWPIGSLMDFGCGFGDLYPYIRGSGIMYYGSDQNYEMEKETTKRYPELVGRINCRLPAFKKFDMVVALGVLSTVDPRRCREFMKDLFDLSHKYVLVSFLDIEEKLLGRYWGQFNAHEKEMVFGKHTCIRLEACHGELTALLVKHA